LEVAQQSLRDRSWSKIASSTCDAGYRTKIVHIRDEYTPVLGASNSIKYGMAAAPDKESAKDHKSFCIEDRLRAMLQQIANRKNKDAPYT